MKISKKNYFIASQGSFRVIPSSWTEKILDHAKTAVEGDKIKLGNNIFKLNYISESYKYSSKSIYYVSDSDQYLIRVSDHWSESDFRGVKTCGNIRSCFWTINGRKQPVVSRFHGGIVKFSDLAPNC